VPARIRARSPTPQIRWRSCRREGWGSAASWPGVIILNRSGGNGQSKGAVSVERKHHGCSLSKILQVALQVALLSSFSLFAKAHSVWLAHLAIEHLHVFPTPVLLNAQNSPRDVT
jgi:hypothetical protein